MFDFSKNGIYDFHGTQLVVFHSGVGSNWIPTRDLFRQAGGFAATIDPYTDLTEEMLDLPKGSIKKEGTILVLSEIASKLPSEVIDALLFHEKGHLVYGHMEVLPTEEESKTGIMNRLTSELEADAYAAQAVGKKAISGALSKVCQLFYDMAFKKDPVRAAALPDFKMLPGMKERFDALL